MTDTLTAFYLFYCQVVSKNDVLNLFFDTPRSLFAHNLSKVYEGAALVREISPEIRMRCRKNDTRPGFLPKYPDERREITLPSGLSPQKREPRAQSSAGEPSGFAPRHCFESMAVVFAIDGACSPASVRLAYSPHAVPIVVYFNTMRSATERRYAAISGSIPQSAGDWPNGLP